MAASEATSIGRGGIQVLSEITGMDRKTIRRGIVDLKKKSKDVDRVRAQGGGRKKIVDKIPDIKQRIEALIEPDVIGDPESPLRWTTKSVRNISEFLLKEGCSVSHQTVASILYKLEFSLQGNRKTQEGKNHPDRDAQFKHINKVVKQFLKMKMPVISVDTKKKELVENYKNPGKEWEKKENPGKVNGHDFPDHSVPKAVPYGVYDITVDSIRYWWNNVGKKKISKCEEITDLCRCWRQ